MASRKTSSSEDSNDTPETGNKNCTNIFRNDGSFLEMFKKMQNTSPIGVNSPKKINNNEIVLSNSHRESEEESLTEKSKQIVSKPVPIVGRRKCNKALPVGKVKKLKAEEETTQKNSTTDAWAKYLEEVKKYKETYCDSESKNRSLVK